MLGLNSASRLPRRYVVDNPDWLFGAIGEIGVDGDSILFDCPGDTDFHPHLNILEVFGALLLAKDFRVCVVSEFMRSTSQFYSSFNNSLVLL